MAERALATNRERAREIESALLRLADGDGIDEEARLDAARAAHKIAGSAGTFGRARASRLARQLEHYLLDGASTRSEELLPALTALEDLHGELAAGALTPETTSHARRRQVLVAVADPGLAGRVGVAAQDRDWDSRWAGDEAAARSVLAQGPDVAIVDPVLPPAGGLDLLTAAARRSPPVPSLVLVRRDAFLDRVEAARAGAVGFVDLDLPPERIVDAAIDAVRADDDERTRVLALDDDVLIVDAVHALFRDTAVDVTGVLDPADFWSELERVQPDLLLLDVDMPGLSGLELCRLVRADARWGTLPVVVLTGSVRSDDVAEVFRAGADDYVTKPVAGEELVARIAGRLERERQRRRTAETDHVTGLPARGVFEDRYARLAERMSRSGEPVALALLAVAPEPADPQDHAPGGADRVVRRAASQLREALGSQDLVARWSDHELVAAMPGLRREDGVARVAGVLESWRTAGTGGDGHPRVSAAVAEHGADGSDLRALGEALTRTVAAAVHAGGDRVLPVGWRPEEDPDVVDVLLVEDDETLAEVLLHSLRTRGLRGRHIGDGQEALRRLAGEPPLSARVVLLDVDLPGLNGLDVLGRLAAQGVLARSRVVMLTAHAGESEILAALRLGAFDHVAKPFSLPVLMQRIRRALAR